MRVVEGKMTAGGMRVGIVAARFNEFITSKLVGGALDVLRRHEVADEDIVTAWVPRFRLLQRKWRRAEDLTQ